MKLLLLLLLTFGISSQVYAKHNGTVTSRDILGDLRPVCKLKVNGQTVYVTCGSDSVTCSSTDDGASCSHKGFGRGVVVLPKSRIKKNSKRNSGMSL